MNKKNLIINVFFGILIVAWSCFIYKVIIYHGLGYMGQTGGFKLDAVIISGMMIFDAILVALFTIFNIKKD